VVGLRDVSLPVGGKGMHYTCFLHAIYYDFIDALCRYSILCMTGVLALMSCAVVGTRSLSEGFTAVWSAFMLLALSIGGTMIMRKFHNSMAVGFFMGGVVAMAQMFFFLSLVYVLLRMMFSGTDLLLMLYPVLVFSFIADIWATEGITWMMEFLLSRNYL
jgi:hypothetical protein